MKVSLLQATLWPLHTNKTISFLRSSPLHIIQGSPWKGIHLGDRDSKTINQKLARSPSIPCWVRRCLPLSGLADCSFWGCHLNVFGFLSAYRAESKIVVVGSEEEEMMGSYNWVLSCFSFARWKIPEICCRIVCLQLTVLYYTFKNYVGKFYVICFIPRT